MAQRVLRPEQSRRDLSLAYAAAMVVALGFAIPVWAVPNIRYTELTSSIAIAFVLIGALKLARLLWVGQPHLVSIAVWTFFYSFLALPLLAQVTARQYVLGTTYTYTDATILEAEAIIAVGLFGYESARLFVRGRKKPLRVTTSARPFHVSVTRAAILGYVGFAFVALSVAKHGIASFFISRDALTQDFLGPAAEGVKFYLNTNKAAGASLQVLAQVPTFIGLYLLLYVRHNSRSDSSGKSPSWALMAPLIVANIVINNPIANARFWYGTVLIGFACIYLPLQNRRWASRLFVVIFVGTSLFSFHQLAAFRRTGGADFSAAPLKQALQSDPDYASPQQILNGIEYVHANGFRLGQQLIGTVFIVVPRAIWPGKIGDTGQLVGGAAGFKVSAPIWTEGFVDWGFLGVFAYLLVVGLLALRLDHRFVRTRAPDLFVALSPIMASLAVFIIRGSLQPAFGSTLPVIACLVFCLSRPLDKGGSETDTTPIAKKAPPDT